jgi:hypothetical protein
VICTYFGFHFLDGLLYFIAGLRTFVIISVSFGYRARCGSSVVNNSKKLRVRGNEILYFVDFDTRRRLMGSCTIRAPVLKPRQVPVYRAYILTQDVG